MKKMLVTAVGAALLLSLVTPSAAHAESGGGVNADRAASARTVAHVGGGYWEYGTANGFVQSFYSHASKTHKATACDGANRCTYTGWKAKGVYASAIRDKTATGNTAYWGVK